MDPKDYRTVEAMVRAFEQVASIVRTENPDCIVAPMMGAVPFIDVLNIIDEEFPLEKVEYVPASNKIHRLRDVLRGTFVNLIDAHALNGGKFLSLDEVVSGNSLVRVYKQFDAARQISATEATKNMFGKDIDFREERVRTFYNDKLAEIQYKTVGIVDPKLERASKKKNPEYVKLVERGIVLPVDTKGIVTMDRTGFFPASYRIAEDSEGSRIYLPVVDTFTISREYVTFLGTVAEIVGKDPARVTVCNLEKIRRSYQMVPEHLRSV